MTRAKGANLVGQLVHLYWKGDRKFYRGTLASFDALSKKHSVLYDDGDERLYDMSRKEHYFSDCHTVGLWRRPLPASQPAA